MNWGVCSMQLVGQIIRVADVSTADCRQMLNLLRKNYDNVTCTEFDSDLDEKDWVILTREPNSGEVMGFSTQQMYNQQTSEGPI